MNFISAMSGSDSNSVIKRAIKNAQKVAKMAKNLQNGKKPPKWKEPAKIPYFRKKKPKNLHQFGVRFTKKPMNFISAMSGSNGNSMIEHAAQTGQKVAKMAKKRQNTRFWKKEAQKLSSIQSQIYKEPNELYLSDVWIRRQ